MSSQEPSSEQPKEEPQPEEQPKEEAPSEEQPGEEPEIHEAPREQPQPEFVAPQTPPPGYPPPQGYAPPQGYPGPQEYRQPPPGYPPPQGYAPPQGYYAGQVVAPRRRTSLWLGCLIAFIVVLFLCAGLAVVGSLLGFGFGIGGAFRNSTTEPVQTFSVGTSPALVLTSEAGSITVNRGSASSIFVQATKYANFGGNLKDVTIDYSQSGDTVNVTVHRSPTVSFFNSTSVDFTITAPSTTNLQLTTNAGSINVNGIGGKMSLKSNAGSIGVTQASLTDSSTFRTNAGSINFNGSIGTTGTYDFETNAGSIDMTLTGTPSFHVNATTNVGSINTSFPVTVNSSGAGATTNSDVGTSPQAILTLKTNAGSITLNRG